MLLPGHPGGVSWYEQFFWTLADICNLGQQGDLYTNSIQGTPKLWKCWNYDMESRSLPSLLICADPCIECYLHTCIFIHLVDLPPDQEDDCHEVEDDEGGDEDGSLWSVVSVTLSSCNHHPRTSETKNTVYRLWTFLTRWIKLKLKFLSKLDILYILNLLKTLNTANNKICDAH